MRGPILLACLATSMFHALGHTAEFPYVAYVSSDDVYVRSGPGKNYYPTAKLKRGEQVEVYRHDPGGWYAIRPPRQSFSWVSARQLDPAEKRLAVVNTDRAVARVGSVFSEMRDVIQVRLNKGERVELVEAEPVADGKWYKIAPPAGEFRWIHREYLDRQAPLDDVAVDDADEDNDEEESASRRAAQVTPDRARYPAGQRRFGGRRRRRAARGATPRALEPNARPTTSRPSAGGRMRTPINRSPSKSPTSTWICRPWSPKNSASGRSPTCGPGQHG